MPMEVIEIDVGMGDWISKSFEGGVGDAAEALLVSTIQQTLGMLSRQTGDSSLSVATDGALGPRTVAAINKAMQYVAIVAPSLKTGLTQNQVLANLNAIQIALSGEVLRRGAVPEQRVATTAKKKTTTKPPIIKPPTFTVPEPWYVRHKTKLMVGGGVIVGLGILFAVFGGGEKRPA
jgi:hypothetical protein